MFPRGSKHPIIKYFIAIVVQVSGGYMLIGTWTLRVYSIWGLGFLGFVWLGF